MSGFVSLPPASDADPPETPAPEVVAGDGWWPDVNLVALRDAVRIDTTVSSARLREAVVNAMISLADDMVEYRLIQVASGYDSLAEVPAPVIDGDSRLMHLYTRAVASTVAADLAERLRDVSATAAGADRATEEDTPVCDHRRNARWAVCDIVGRRRNTIELI